MKEYIHAGVVIEKEPDEVIMRAQNLSSPRMLIDNNLKDYFNEIRQIKAQLKELYINCDINDFLKVRTINRLNRRKGFLSGKVVELQRMRKIVHVVVSKNMYKAKIIWD